MLQITFRLIVGKARQDGAYKSEGAAKMQLAIVGLVSPASSIPTPRFHRVWRLETVGEEPEQWVLLRAPAMGCRCGNSSHLRRQLFGSMLRAVEDARSHDSLALHVVRLDDTVPTFSCTILYVKARDGSILEQIVVVLSLFLA